MNWGGLSKERIVECCYKDESGIVMWDDCALGKESLNV